MQQEPFFFESEAQSVFGVYHAPATLADRDVGVVIAPPWGREYLKAHRALRQLAVRFSRSGFHVLRFDFRGCGDSAGDAAQANLELWKRDVIAAVEELRDRSGVSRVVVVGLRLGATLALLAADKRRDIAALALWEPVLNGKEYVAELAAVAAGWSEGNRIETAALPAGIHCDVMGFPLGEPLVESLSSLSLEFGRRPAGKVLLLSEEPRSAECQRLLNALRELGVNAADQRAPGARIWADSEGVARALIPQDVLGNLVDWVANEVA
jgi:exosortase A-associated hydrolase 2